MIAKILAMLGVLFALGAEYPKHVSGILNVETGNQDRRPGTWRDTIQYLDPDRTPFTQLLTRLSTKKVSDPEFKLFERERRSRWVRVNNGSGYTSAATSIVVDEGGMTKAGEIILVARTGERMLVTAVSANTLTVTRGVLGSTAAAIVDDDWFKVLFERQQEHGRSGTPITTDYKTVTNFTQILKQPYGISRTNKQTRKRGPQDLAEERKLAMQRFKEDMEQMIIWGKKRLEVVDGVTYRYTGGFDEFVSTNRVDLDGAVGWGDFGWLMNQATRYGGTKKIWLVGRDFRMQMDAAGLDYLRIPAEKNVLGMAVDGFRTSFGEAMLVTHHGLENEHAGLALVVDPGHISLASLMAMKHEANLQENDRDGEKHQFIAECGLWLDTERAHMVIENAAGTV